MSEKLEVTVGTHFFQVRPGESLKYKALCMSFVRRFVKVDVQGQTQTVTTFAAANLARTWFRFHINAFREFDNQLLLNGVKKEDVILTILPEPTVEPCEIKVLDKWSPRDEQKPILEYLKAPVGRKDDTTGYWVEGSSRSRLVGIQTGAGKAFPMDEVVQTPIGPRKNRDLVIGDVIYAWDGTQTSVKTIHPQGLQRGYEVKFCDGRALVTCEDHLWGVYLGGDMERAIVPTKALNQLLQEYGSVRIDLPVAGSKEDHEKLEAILKEHASKQTDEYGTVIVKTPDVALAREWRDLARRCGARVTLLEVNGKSHMLFITPRGDCFGNNTIAMMRVRDTMEDVEMQCIEIDHPDKLFVAGDWVVTHNTYCALQAISDLGYKFVVIVLAQFVEKWAGTYDKKTKEYIPGDICKTMNMKPQEILQVQGGASMQALTQMAITPGSMDKFKCVVISNRTFDNYLRAYQNYGLEMDTMGYMVPPDELWVKLGIGIRLIDEVHMHFHANFRLDLFTHIHRSISLSATLRSNDETMVKMYKVAYPPVERYHEGPVDKHANAYGVIYGLPDNWSYKTTHRGTSNYNHTAYESSILKNKEFLKAYGDMFAYYLQQGFKANYKPGNKFIVFAASVDMCTKLTEHLQKKFPEYSIKRYVSEDDYETNYKQPVGRVTTIGSGGTGHDLPGLTDGHLGTAIDSIQSNIQAFGRLRKSDQETRYYAYSCENIAKQMGYHNKRKDMFKDRAKSYSALWYGTLGQNAYCT